MNPFIAVLFQAIPLVMGTFTMGLGLLVLEGAKNESAFVAGHVLVFFTAICVALFCTAATIIRLLTKTSSPFWRTAMPLLGYASGLGTVGYGLWLLSGGSLPQLMVAGHLVLGLGFVSCCVATVATASIKFPLIPANSQGAPGTVPPGAFSSTASALLLAVPVVCALAAFVVAAGFCAAGSTTTHTVVGCVLGGIGLVCASLVGLVVSLVRQVCNTYGETDRRLWPGLVAVTGGLNIIAGLAVLATMDEPELMASGFVLIGLGIVCYSILSKVLLLALVWRRSFPLASRIPLIPVCTALLCLFLAVILFQVAPHVPGLFIPARVMAGLGAVCVTLFAIVSILESGTSGDS